MINIFSGSFGRRHNDPTRCRASVADGGRSVSFHQCSRKPIIHREVGGKFYGFCKQHDPVAVDKRIKERTAKWHAEWDASDKRAERSRLEREVFEACRAALEKIEKGRNDPRTLARDTLALFPEGGVMIKKTDRFFTEAEVREMLKLAYEGCGGQSAWCLQHNVGRRFVWGTLTGQHKPTKRILQVLGLEAVITYRRRNR